MRKVLCIIFAAFAVFGRIQCGVTPVAGKCRPLTCPTIPIDFEKLAGLGKWDILYATNIHVYTHADHVLVDATPITNGVYRVDNRRTFDDNSTDVYTFIITYVDNVVIEDTVENGERHQFRIFPLALSGENGLLYYRCSDNGQPGVDTRILKGLRENVLSEEGVQDLLAADKACNFRGELKKLPKKLTG